MLTHREKMIFRDLSKKVREIANDPIQIEKRKKWTLHNDMKKTSPIIWVFPSSGAWEDMIPSSTLQISDKFFRRYEMELRSKIYKHEVLKDDHVIEPVLQISMDGKYTGWGLDVKHHQSSIRGGSFGFDSTLNTEEDLETMLSHPHDFIFDDAGMAKNIEMLNDVMEGHLDIQLDFPRLVAVGGLLHELIHLRGFTPMLMDLYDNPDFFHKVMDHMSSSKLALLKKLEKEGRLVLNNGQDYVGSGGMGYTSQLPKEGQENGKVRICDLWGFADAQEFTDVSSDMLEEFVLPYQRRILDEFGLNCYACCERLDSKKFDAILQIPNIRRISVSPWTDVQLAADKIGRKCIYSRKPSPALVTVSFDEEAVKKDLRGVYKAAGDCNLEIILKDIETCNGHPEYLTRWVEIARSICE